MKMTASIDKESLSICVDRAFAWDIVLGKPSSMKPCSEGKLDNLSNMISMVSSSGTSNPAFMNSAALIPSAELLLK